jgi:tetratricopeptide (TPR) repeat protein
MKINRTLRVLGLAVIALAICGSMSAQEGRGVGRIGGVVVDLEGNPIEGAKLVLSFAQNQNLKFESASNKKGEWSFLGLGTGNWKLAIAAKGYLPVDKTLYVSQLSVNPKVTVKLQKGVMGGGGFIADDTSFEFLEKGNQLLNEQKYDEALAAYQQFLEKNPQAYQVKVSLADCYRGKGEYDKAIEIYNQALEEAKTDAALGKEITAKAFSGIGNCYLKQDKIPEAQKLFEQSIENSPDDEILAYNVGEIYFSNQKYDEAIRYFELAAKIKPEWPDSYLKLGYVYLNKSDMPAAIQQFDKFLSLEPDTERSALVKNILSAIKK